MIHPVEANLGATRCDLAAIDLLDHIGVVIGTTPGGVLSAEGNNSNRTGVFPRSVSVIAGFVRLPENG